MQKHLTFIFGKTHAKEAEVLYEIYKYDPDVLQPQLMKGAKPFLETLKEYHEKYGDLVIIISNASNEKIIQNEIKLCGWESILERSGKPAPMVIPQQLPGKSKQYSKPHIQHGKTALAYPDTNIDPLNALSQHQPIQIIVSGDGFKIDGEEAFKMRLHLHLDEPIEVNGYIFTDYCKANLPNLPITNFAQLSIKNIDNVDQLLDKVNVDGTHELDSVSAYNFSLYTH